MFTVNCIEKTKIKKKRTRMANFLLKLERERERPCAKIKKMLNFLCNDRNLHKTET